MAQIIVPNERRRRLRAGLAGAAAVGLVAFVGWVGYREFRVSALEREATEALDRRDFARGLELLERCVAERPSDAGTVFQAARAARRASQFRKAEHFLQEADRLGWVENALLLERSLLRVQRGSLRTEEPFLIGCVRGGHPDTVLILEVLVPAYARSFDVAAALELLDRWQKLEPNEPAPYFTRGELLEQLRNKAGALEAFREVLRVAPDDAGAHQRCGKLLLEAQRPAEALPHFEWLVGRQPRDAAARLGLARCKVALGETAEGRRLLEELLREEPNAPDVLGECGRLELTAGDPRRAVTLLRQAGALQPNDPELLYALGQALARVGQPEEAEKCWARRAQAEKDLDRLYDLKKQAAARPLDAAPRHEAGLILMRNGYRDAGVQWLQTALRVDPSYAPSHEALAAYYESAGDAARAEPHRQAARELAAKRQPPAGR